MPAAPWLFKTDKVTKETRSETLRHVSEVYGQNTLSTKRSRPDLKPTMGSLQMRVHSQNKDGWHKKFMRVMCFIKSKVEDVRTIEADSLYHMLTMIDSAHAVHKDMRGHTGGLLTFGTGRADQK